MAKKPSRGVDAKGCSKRRGKFVALSYDLVKSPAWRSLSGSAVRYYLELRTRYNGFNNGDLSLSLGEAKELLGMGRHTTIRAQQELQERGFIHLSARGGYYQHLATTWRLTDCRMPKRQATNDWKIWQPKKIPQCHNSTEVVPKRHRENGSGEARGQGCDQAVVGDPPGGPLVELALDTEQDGVIGQEVVGPALEPREGAGNVHAAAVAWHVRIATGRLAIEGQADHRLGAHGGTLEHNSSTFTRVKGKPRSIATRALVAYATAPNSLRSKGSRVGEFRTIPLVPNSL